MNQNLKITMKFILAIGVATGITTAATLTAAQAETAVKAKTRYLVVYKSQQGHQAMENFMRLESAKAYGMTESLKHIQSTVIKTAQPQVIEQLRNHPEVAIIEAESFRPAPVPVNGFRLSMTERKRSQKKSLPALDPVDQSMSIDFKAGEGTPWGILAVKAPEAWLLSDGGAKARVLVLDTGIDKDHPALKNNFEAGRNFFESDAGPNPNDYEDAVGHGTHCSGTIAAAYNEQTGFVGVAPKAKLLMGRVCGDLGCSNIAVASGINWGVSQKVDVISMSLGGPMSSAGERMAIANAEKNGVVVIAASGNDGTQKVSFPAALPTVYAVGALGPDLKKTNFSQWGPELDITAPGASVMSSIPQGTGRDSVVDIVSSVGKIRIKSAAFSGTKEIVTTKSAQLVSAGLGKPDDFKNINVRGKFALISRGEIAFSDKVNNALKAGALGAVIYNNAPGLMQGALTQDGSELDVVAVMIEQAEGLKLVEALNKGEATEAEVSTIRSDYALYDGTSMATPHVAGVAALIKSANKNLTPAQVRAILSSTAMALGPNETNQYGSGIVQADKAVAAALK